MEDYRVASEDTSREVLEGKENQEKSEQNVSSAKPPKPKKKVKKINVKVSDHGDQVDKAEDQEEKSEMTGMGDTLFILDLMRQRKEKLMRKKKDDMINEMAMKKKQQMIEARQGKRVLTRPSFGGFIGVGAVLANSRCTSPAPSWGRRTPRPREHSPEIDIPGPQDTELLIMGIIRDKKEEKFHEAHHVKMEQAGVPSDDRTLAKFSD